MGGRSSRARTHPRDTGPAVRAPWGVSAPCAALGAPGVVLPMPRIEPLYQPTPTEIHAIRASAREAMHREWHGDDWADRDRKRFTSTPSLHKKRPCHRGTGARTSIPRGRDSLAMLTGWYPCRFRLPRWRRRHSWWPNPFAGGRNRSSRRLSYASCRPHPSCCSRGRT